MQDQYSYLSNVSPEYIEELYQQYRNDPSQVPEDWQRFFEGFEFREKHYEKSISEYNFSKEFNVLNLINSYRQRAHLFTKTNPVRQRRKYTPTLEIENYGLNPSDLDARFLAGQEIGIGKATLRDILKHLNRTYRQSVGVEYMYIRTPEIVSWLQKKMESCQNIPDFSTQEKINILQKLGEAVFFEKFIHKKFPGQKRFSLEGAEALIPGMKMLIEKGALYGVKEFVIGMPHRGRLNILANILHKSYDDIFSEFEGKEYEESFLLGDVKYHLGYSSDFVTKEGKKVHLTLSPNPSHLEAVSGVLEGIARAKSDRLYQNDYQKVLPILIHGDASIAGQGIVYEIVQMSALNAYKTGGTIHLVVNNQLGFTTNYLEGRSSTYCTDIGKVIQAPIFHVNGDDVEEVVYVFQLAMEFRQKFQKDVFIDLLCYRKYGHNESDEPRFTQPLLYKLIEKHDNPLDIYLKKLEKIGSIDKEITDEMRFSFNEQLEQDFKDAKKIKKAIITPFLHDPWKEYRRAKKNDFVQSPDTSFEEKELQDIAEKITLVPESIKLFRKLDKLMRDRHDMVFKENKIDWGMCELLALGSIIKEGYPIRFSGQDVARGTFSQRHAVLRIEDSEEAYIPLSNISKNQPPFEIYNSLLSEYAVLGFEYGFSITDPRSLVIWEAQFGDFVNGAQIVVDQFIASAEEKWGTQCGLVVLLPHGYEGQGPEHSSGRMERFLAACADLNIQIANCSTPGNYFHILRRQVKRNFRKPLIIFTPKSLLRHPACFSSKKDLTNKKFQEIITVHYAEPEKVRKVIFCTGKIYYELSEQIAIKNIADIAIIRIEQLYPFPKDQISETRRIYSKSKQWLWVQEEPENMGACQFIKSQMADFPLQYISRAPSGTTATGSSYMHKMQQKKIIDQALK